MPSSRRIAALVLLAAALVAGPVLAQTVLAGATPDGAFYNIVVPDAWNGDLVIWNHGFSLTPAGPVLDLGPLAPVQVAEGYAVAASGFTQVGWAVFETNRNLEQLYDVFQANFGDPNQVFLFGASLGGIVTARAIEQADLGNVAGALTICGAMAGSRNWDAGVDLRLLYDFICRKVPGAAIPGAAQGLPAGSMLTPTDTVLAANACFGHDLPPAARTLAQQARLDKFLALTQIPQEFINTDLGFFATFGMADLVHDPRKLGGGIGTGNMNVDYGDPAVNRGIQRVKPSNARRKRLRENYIPTGDVGNTKIVSIHTDKDGLIIYENEKEYADVVPRQNLTVGIVVEQTPTHCGFSPAETLAAWEALRGWVGGPAAGQFPPDPQPSALTLQVLCLAFEPVVGGPCRFNPFVVIPDMDGRIRPRNTGGLATRATKSVAVTSGPAPAAPAAPPRVQQPEASAQAAPSPPAPAVEPAPQKQPGPARSQRAVLPSAADDVEAPVGRARKLARREE